MVDAQVVTPSRLCVIVCLNPKRLTRAIRVSTRRKALQLDRDISIESFNASSLSRLQFREKTVKM